MPWIDGFLPDVMLEYAAANVPATWVAPCGEWPSGAVIGQQPAEAGLDEVGPVLQGCLTRSLA